MAIFWLTRLALQVPKLDDLDKKEFTKFVKFMKEQEFSYQPIVYCDPLSKANYTRILEYMIKTKFYFSENVKLVFIHSDDVEMKPCGYSFKF